MIPHTYPSQLDSENRTQMVIYYLTSISGLERWKDYIPVKENNLASLELNSFSSTGAIYTTTLSNISGKQAWIDYVPVYRDDAATNAWSVSATGYLATKDINSLQALAIIASYGADAHLYLPGVGVINGLNAGNYLDSAGTTVATVDNPVGLGLDAANSVIGSELVANGDFSNGTTGWTVPAGCTIASGKASFITTVSPAILSRALASTANKLYLLQFEILDYVSGTCYVRLNNPGSVLGTSFSGNGVKSCYVLAGANYDTVGLVVNTNSSLSVDNVSVKEVTGIHAIQATTANKPILRRGAVNLLLYSEDFSNAIWTVSGAAVKTANYAASPTGTLTACRVQLPTNSTDELRQAYGETAGGNVIYTAAIYIKSNTGSNQTIRLKNTHGGVKDNFLEVTATTSWQRVNLTVTNGVAAGTSQILGVVNATDGVEKDILIANAMLNTGTLADYIPTTTAAASSATGNYHWVHDSTDVLTATFPAGYESATTINASTAGQITLTAQNIVGAYNIGPSTDTYGRFVFKTITASELAIMQQFANRLAGL